MINVDNKIKNIYYMLCYSLNKDLLSESEVSNVDSESFDNIYNALKNNDRYMALADYADYCNAQKKAQALYNDSKKWNQMSLTNIAKSGIFAADRSIDDYAKNIWHINPVE